MEGAGLAHNLSFTTKGIQTLGVWGLVLSV